MLKNLSYLLDSDLLYRIRIGDITSPKDLIGLKDFTLEITSDKPESEVFEFAEKIFKQRDIWAKDREFVFLDQKKISM